VDNDAALLNFSRPKPRAVLQQATDDGSNTDSETLGRASPLSAAAQGNKRMRLNIIAHGDSKGGSVDSCGAKVDASKYARVHYLF